MPTFELPKNLKTIIRHAPTTPGVYRMLDKDGNVIYVGKAKAIKKRLQGHFRITKSTSPKNLKMVEQVADIAYTEVQSELDALILETNFIKDLRPKYNILMRDDKSHTFLKITIKDDFPRIYAVRNPVNDGSLFFGPYTSTDPITKLHKVFRKLFPYRSCDLTINEVSFGNVTVSPKGRRLPCLDYYIKRCGAPCKGYVSKEDYRVIIDQVIDFIQGRSNNLLDEMEKKMHDLAQKKDFEKAAQVRDQLTSLRRLTEKQVVVSIDYPNLDVIGIAKSVGKYGVTLMRVRFGKLVSQENFLMQNVLEDEEGSVLSQFITQYYKRAQDIPGHVLVSKSLGDVDLLESYLSSITDTRMHLVQPVRGKKAEILRLANANASSYLEQNKVRWMSDKKKTVEAAKNLASHLSIERELKRIECFDISHVQGTETVGSMIVFSDGVPDKSEYRRFKLKGIERGEVNDFASMMEVLRRRLTYLVDTSKRLKKDQKFAAWPDLIILDGGKGQLSSVMKIVRELKLEKKLSVIALAKREEEVFVPGKKDPIWIPLESEEQYLIQRIRDEAHRFAVSFHQVLRRKRMVKSVLDNIKGLGPKRKKLLLQTFGSVSGIKKATDAEIRDLVGDDLLQRLRERL